MSNKNYIPLASNKWRDYLRDRRMELWAADSRGFRKSRRDVHIWFENGQVIPYAFVVRRISDRNGKVGA
jgi:hypothetical protein